MIDTSLSADRDPAVAPPPVFVDGSGQRQRRVRRVGRLLAVPAVGYLALLVSSMLGGPSISAPFLPQGPAHAVSTAPVPEASASAPAVTTGGPAPGRSAAVGPAARPTATAAHGSGEPTPAASGTTAVPTTTPPPTATAAPGHGKPTAPPSHRPTKTP
ncbi:hypothetical protein AB0K51_06720 [Kitasatospora sp. NPDC049285]|uniref:hypothetical protein n=1 Tax=Kitasatospora sp. NPDC049285 TaxID=3157096 RepID=UPI00341461D3